MLTTATTLPIVDLEPITVKAMEEGKTLQEAALGAQELLRFYALRQQYPGEALVPSKLMDEMWHHHILDTEKYPSDCDAMFGHFLHHFPYLGLRGEEDKKQLAAKFAKTQALYLATFGEEMAGDSGASICEPRTSDCASTCSAQHAECSGGCGPTKGARPTLAAYLAAHN